MRAFYGWIFYPIRDLRDGVSRIGEGNLDVRLTVASGDEMEELACAFNAMMNRLQNLYSSLEKQVAERSRQLVRSERLARRKRHRSSLQEALQHCRRRRRQSFRSRQRE